MIATSIFDALLKGVPVTVEVTVLGSLLMVISAVIAGVLRLSRRRIVRVLAGIYIEVWRGTSAIVQLYFAYYALPFWGVTLPPFVAGFVVIGLNTGAYGAEVVRGAIRSVPQGQVEAAIALNMGSWARFRRVVMPHATRIILPSAGGLTIEVLKTSSLVSLVTLLDITFRAQQLRLTTGQTAQIFGIALLFYLVLASLIDVGVKALERRAGRGYRTHLAVGPTIWERLRRPLAAHGRQP